MRHCISLGEFSGEEILHMVQLAHKLKQERNSFSGVFKGRTLLLLFQKTSTRTRLSFEVGFGRLGGQVVVMNWDTSNFAISPLEYEALYVSRQTDLMMARLKHHADIRNLAEHSIVPVINGCDDRYHPCQALADLLTIYEHTGTFKGQTLTYVGIQNNVSNSLSHALTSVGARIILVTPESNPAAEDPELLEQLSSTGLMERTLDLRAAVAKSGWVYTDTWVDMEFYHDPAYQEEKQRRIALMSPYQLNEKKLAGSKARILHDMPIHPGFEISKELVHDPRSVIFQQADNRLYVQQALMMYLLGLANG
ncbi:MAG: ornithine carbamoyltransferase [Deltaproteobacteria bacterium]|nr:ornithine carbamoyltransferase [Deltaproteobacteria bacterium]